MLFLALAMRKIEKQFGLARFGFVFRSTLRLSHEDMMMFHLLKYRLIDLIIDELIHNHL